MPKKKPVWGMVLDASSSIDDHIASMSGAMKSHGRYYSWNDFHGIPVPSGTTISRAMDTWTTFKAYKSTTNNENRFDNLYVYGLGNNAFQGVQGPNQTLNFRAKYLQSDADGNHYIKWKFLQNKSKVGMLELNDKTSTGAMVSQDIMWTADVAAGSVISYNSTTAKNVLKAFGQGFDVREEKIHAFLINGDKHVTLGDKNDIVSMFFPDHYLDDNGHNPMDTDRSPTGRYKGGSFIDGGGGFDRVIYDDGLSQSVFGKELPRSDFQKFLRDDFKITAVGNTLKGVFEVENTKYGWTDRIKNIEQLEFAVSGLQGGGSVTVDIGSPFTHGDDKFKFEGKLAALQDLAEMGMTFNKAGDGNDRVRLPSHFSVREDGTLYNYGIGNNFNAGDGDDVIFGGNDQDFIRGGKDNDTLHGDPGVRNGGPDKLFGGGGKDWLDGRAGNDWLVGGKGHDMLWGGKGADTLNGGKGRDRLMGDEGRDTLKGGKGSDTFIFGGKFGRDKILDFQATGPRKQQDHIELRNGVFHNSLGDEAETLREFKDASKQVGNRVIYDAHDDGRNVIVLKGVDMDDLTGFNFDFL